MLYQELSVWKRLDKTTAVRFRCLISLETKKVSVQSVDYYRPGVDAKHITQLANNFVELFCENDPGERSGAFDSVEEAIAEFERSFASDDEE